MEKIIEIKHLSKSFDDKCILHDINLYINKGEFITFLGPSGCGKTTLLRLIAGFLEADKGSIIMGGEDISNLPPNKRQLNTVFQRYALFPHLDVYDNIAFGLKLKKIPENEIEKKVKKVLKMVSMSDYEFRDVNSLSGGQQQRVAIARAIANEPKVLLLDEPLAALDLKMRKDMQMELKEMHKNLGITFIYVTHDQEEALTLSDTIVVMNEGKIQQIGTPTDIYNEPQNEFVADFIGESNILDGKMICDRKVEFLGHEFDCIDEGFGENCPVDVVVRPEDIYIFPHSDKAQFCGTVKSSIFKGVHYEMTIVTDEGYEILVQDYNTFDIDSKVGMLIKPGDIQVMKKDGICNEFEAELISENKISFLDQEWEITEKQFQSISSKGIKEGDKVKVSVDFDKVELLDEISQGQISGHITFILYKGDHYMITVQTDEGKKIKISTNDIWDKSDLVGISINSDNIRIDSL